FGDPMKILIADDEQLARARLRRLLGALEDVEIAGEATDGTEVLAFIKKRLNKQKAKEMIDLTNKVGIDTRCFFMMGFPTETKEEIEETIRFSLELNPTFITYSIATPLPNTEMWDMLQGKMNYDAWYQFNSFGADKLVYVPEGMTQEELMHLYKKAHRVFLLRPSWWAGRIVDVVKNPFNLIRFYRASSAMKLVA
ncbi:MAG: radical SAM protein, partial [archaeon]